MTPRQIAAFLHFVDREDALQEARSYVVTALANGGDEKTTEKYLASLLGE